MAHNKFIKSVILNNNDRCSFNIGFDIIKFRYKYCVKVTFIL